MNGGTTALSSASLVLTSTVHIAEKSFEFAAVDEQARAILQIVHQVSSQLSDAKTLRHQKSSLYTATEKSMFDSTFTYVEEAIQQVAALAECSKIDTQMSGGGVLAKTRLLFVLRDSPGVRVSRTKLSIARQSLNTAVVLLSDREWEDNRTDFTATDSSPPVMQGELKPPPTYEESLFFTENRRRNMKKRESAMSLVERPHSSASQHFKPTQNIYELATSEDPELFVEHSTPSVLITATTPRQGSPVCDLQARYDHHTLQQTPRSSRARARSQNWLHARCQ